MRLVAAQDTAHAHELDLQEEAILELLRCRSKLLRRLVHSLVDTLLVL